MNLDLPKAILLDLDDTILSYSSIKEMCWKEVAEEHSGSLGGVKPEDFVANILQHSNWFWSDENRHRKWRKNLRAAREEIVALSLKDQGIYEENLCKEIAGAYSRVRNVRIKPIPGALDALTAFRENGMKTALLTNGTSESQRSKIDRFALESFFDLILIEGEQGFGKPDRRIYLKALETLGVKPQETWMVGDNITWDVIAPQELGIKGVWINYKNEVLKDDSGNKPFLSLSSLPEILNHLW